VAREIGADLDTVRATAAEYFALYPSAYNPATATVTDFGRDVLLAVFTNDDPEDEAAPSHT
jgi:HJR/Mrr/RecB family endonuclease